jgi:hypothetical protein
VELAEKLAGTGVKVAKFRADGEQMPFAQAELQLSSFPTVLLFPSRTARPISTCLRRGTSTASVFKKLADTKKIGSFDSVGFLKNWPNSVKTSQNLFN